MPEPTAPDGGTPQDVPGFDLLTRLAGGEVNEELVSAVVDIYVPLLIRYAGTLGVQPDDAAPLVQDVLVRSTRYLLKFKAVSSFPAATVMHLRRLISTSPQFLHRGASVESSTQTPAAAADINARVRDYMANSLTADELELLLLRTLEAQSEERIAEMLGESVATVTERVNKLFLNFVNELNLLRDRAGTS